MFIPQRTEASIAAEKAGHGTYAVDWATADDRIRLCKGIVTDTNQQMDPERLSVLKAVYEENLGEEPVLIRAKLLERLLLTKKLFLDEEPRGGHADQYPLRSVRLSRVELRLDQGRDGYGQDLLPGRDRHP